ncbi:unnamed protein product [Prunus armeniaca]|uniref:Uncharacterized protein n=1 Tax=Prunus armeniaca TaxID=36596 RepID=A0A6J5TX62_PRUAR|nr:unnamed protein product [Prunus armeniaca]CAB4298681.1 unnamed protein product [Prunus armeniaca]
MIELEWVRNEETDHTRGELGQYSETGEKGDEVPIHLNSIAAEKRIRGRAMCLEGFIDRMPIHVFIDSRVDQNFLNPSMAQRLGKVINPKDTEKVVVATGNTYDKCFQRHA